MSKDFLTFAAEHLRRGAPYLGASLNYVESDKVIIGAPMDWTVSFRPGSRFGPQSIREVSIGLEEYSPYQDKVLADKAYFDAGDLILPFGNPSGSLELIKEATNLLHKENKVPIVLGGEHLVSWPAIAAAHARYQDLVLVHFDAHADLRSEFFGESLSHASVIRRACELEPEIKVYQFGIRSGDREEFTYAKTRTKLFPFEVVEPLKAVLPELIGSPVYLTLDIDVADPAYASGTGTPEPGGVSSRELLEAIELLRDCNLVGADIVEVAPDYDLSKRTSFLAAKILRELLLF